MICYNCGKERIKAGQSHEGYYLKCRSCGEILAGFDTKSEAKREWSENIKIHKGAKNAKAD